MWKALLLASALLAGCASQPNERVHDAQRQIASGRFDAGALLLREALHELPADPRTHEQRHDLVLQLARAQLCTAVQYQDPSLAVATHAMLERYEDEHRERLDDRARSRFERYQIDLAKREARIAHEEPETWAIARCRTMRSRSRPAYAGRIENAFLIDPPAQKYKNPRRAWARYGRR